MNPQIRGSAAAQKHLEEIETPDSTLVVAQRDNFEWAWTLWERRTSLWRWTWRALVLSTIIAFLIPKRYEATTRLMPPDQSNPGMAMLAALAGKGAASAGGAGTGVSGLSMLAGDMLGLKSSDALLIGVLRSDTLEDRLISRFDLRKVYSDRYTVDARKQLTRLTEITEDRKSGILTITVTDKNQQRAAALAQAYVEELDKLVAELSTSAARRERMFIEDRLKAVKLDLDAAARDFSEYASKNTAVDIKEQTRAMVESAAVLQGQLGAAQSELEGLEQIYTPNNVRVRSLQARVGELKRQLEKLGGDGTPLKEADPAQAGASTSSDELYPSIRKLPLLGVRWADLYRRTRIEETLYELLTQRYELAKIEEAKEIPTIKVLDVAHEPEKKSGPDRLLVIFVLTACSFSFSALWILGQSRWHRMDEQDPGKVLILTVGQHTKSRFKGYFRFIQSRNGKIPHSTNDDDFNDLAPR
jgi:capsule polysaccharide export protein KpsE/RkpR